MTLKELRKIVELRAKSGNPTESSLMYFISQKLDEYEDLQIENEKLKAQLEEVDC